MLANRIALRGSCLAAMATALLSANAAFAQDRDTDAESSGEDIIVTAQRDNQSQVVRSGSLGALGNQDTMDTPFQIKSYNSALILNQQPQTLGQVLENDPSIRTTNGFGVAAELFVMRGFPLSSDDISFNGLYGLTPRQLVAPELYEQVQVLNGASAFLNGAAPGGSGLGGGINLIAKRAGPEPAKSRHAQLCRDGAFRRRVRFRPPFRQRRIRRADQRRDPQRRRCGGQ